MPPVHYEEVQCKSVLNPVRGMAFSWSINPYRGCVHSCHYCFARRYHAFYDLDASDDFTSVIMVKVNAPAVLRQELSRLSWQRDLVALGTATDPYQPIEGKYHITRGILEALHAFRTPVGIVTKGTMAVRDVDILAEMSRKGRCSVSFSVTTLDRQIWERLEPGTPPPQQRLRAVEKLARSGVNAGVFAAPVVPGITDSVENMEAVARAAAEHGAQFFGASVLYLKPGVKEHFTGFLESRYPDLVARYRRLFPGAYAPSGYARQVYGLVDALQHRYGLLAERSASPSEDLPVQLALAL